jgi:hypothetical protein
MKPRFQGIDNVYKTKADNKDIRDLLEKLVPEATKQMRTFSQSFRGATQEQTCRNIFNYIKNNFTYVADQEEQIIKLPSALLRKKVGDCKSYSLFTAGILSNLGIPYHFVYASYNDNPIPHHVYVETDNGCKIDVVYGIFNQEKKAKYKYKKNMNVRYMAGLGDCGCNNNRMGFTIVSKEKRQAFKEDVKGAVKKVGEKAKDIVSDVKEGAKKIVQKAKTGTPVLVMARGMFITLVKKNYDGIATKISLDDYTDLLNRWYKLGGNRTILTDAIKEGSQKPEKKLAFFKILKKIIGVPVNGMGATSGDAVATIINSPEVKAKITGLCVSTAESIFTEPATATAVGTAFSGVLLTLLPAMANSLQRVVSKGDESITPPNEKEDFTDDGGDDKPKEESFISKNLPYILGGVALLGVGIYFYTKKK